MTLRVLRFLYVTLDDDEYPLSTLEIFSRGGGYP